MKILIVGAGAVSSWLAYFLYYYKIRDQMLDTEITIMDDDKIEGKNLQYCAFYKRSDINKYKAEILAKKTGFKYNIKRVINESQLEDYDLIVLAVDNDATRDIVYKSKKYWIDCRSKGNEYAILVKSRKLKTKKLHIKRPAEGCQYKHMLDEGIIEQGNMISASIGCAQILNHIRGTIRIFEKIGCV